MNTSFQHSLQNLRVNTLAQLQQVSPEAQTLIEKPSFQKMDSSTSENTIPKQDETDNLSNVKSKVSTKVGRWTPEEKQKFVEALKLYGKDWKNVEKFIGTRSGAQIRSHAQKFFINIEKTRGIDIDDYIKELQSSKKRDFKMEQKEQI